MENFLVDDGHKIRLNLLHKEMVKAVEALDKLHGHAYELYTSNSASASEFLKAQDIPSISYIPRSVEDTIQMTQSANHVHNLVGGDKARKLISPATLPETGDEDLMDIELRE